MKSKVVVVTGGFGTLGRAVARVAAARGADVALVDVAALPNPPLRDDDVRPYACFANVDLQERKAAVQVLAEIEARFGGIDALANVAGDFATNPLPAAIWAAGTPCMVRTCEPRSTCPVRSFRIWSSRDVAQSSMSVPQER